MTYIFFLRNYYCFIKDDLVADQRRINSPILMSESWFSATFSEALLAFLQADFFLDEIQGGTGTATAYSAEVLSLYDKTL